VAKRIEGRGRERKENRPSRNVKERGENRMKRGEREREREREREKKFL
jgi:hypothetical protein